MKKKGKAYKEEGGLAECKMRMIGGYSEHGLEEERRERKVLFF